MTAFARADGTAGKASWTWEIRSVNGKSLDVRMRLPSGHEAIEQTVRKAASAQLSRGNVQISLNIDRQGQAAEPVVNETALARLAALTNRVDDEFSLAKSSAAQLLAVRGIVDFIEPELSVSEEENLETALVGTFETALLSLVEARRSEGAALQTVLLEQINQISALTAKAKADPSLDAAAIAERLNDQIARIGLEGSAVEPDRLYQEAALLASKADIQEELDRLSAHCAAARELIENGSPAGRKLEFLAQEFNREANTLCSKANAISLTKIGLELKAVIDQFREQVLNVE